MCLSGATLALLVPAPLSPHPWGVASILPVAHTRVSSVDLGRAAISARVLRWGWGAPSPVTDPLADPPLLACEEAVWRLLDGARAPACSPADSSISLSSADLTTLRMVGSLCRGATGARSPVGCRISSCVVASRNARLPPRPST